MTTSVSEPLDFLIPILNYSSKEKLEWLNKYKHLYYEVIIQPKGLPEIPYCELLKLDVLAKRFYDLYQETLEQLPHKWDYDKCKLSIPIPDEVLKIKKYQQDETEILSQEPSD